MTHQLLRPQKLSPRFSLLDGSYHDSSQAAAREAGGEASNAEGSTALAERGSRDMRPGMGNKGQLAEVRTFCTARIRVQGL